MPLIDVPEFTLLPQTWSGNAFALGLTAAQPKRAILTTAPKAGSITHVGVQVGTGSTTANCKLSLQSVLVSGQEYNASGTPLSGSTFSPTFTPSSNTFFWQPIGNASVAVGDLMAGAVEFDTTVANWNIPYLQNQGIGFFQGAVYVASSSSWAKDSALGAMAIRYSDGSEYGLGSPIVTSNTHSYQQGTNPNERGNRFKLTVGARLSGWWYFGQAAANVNFDLNLYDLADTLLFSRSYNSNQVNAVAGNRRFAFDSMPALSADTWYRMTVKNQSSANWNTREYVFPSQALVNNMEGGANFYSTYRGASGVWTDDPLSKTTVVPYFNAIDTGSGGIQTYRM